MLYSLCLVEYEELSTKQKAAQLCNEFMSAVQLRNILQYIL